MGVQPLLSILRPGLRRVDPAAGGAETALARTPPPRGPASGGTGRPALRTPPRPLPAGAGPAHCRQPRTNPTRPPRPGSATGEAEPWAGLPALRLPRLGEGRAVACPPAARSRIGTMRAPSCRGFLLSERARTRTAMRAGRTGGSAGVVESRGHTAVRPPDLLGQVRELLQVLLAVLHLLLPPRRVDREDRLEVLRRGGDAAEVEFVLCRDYADRRLPAADLAVLEPQQPE